MKSGWFKFSLVWCLHFGHIYKASSTIIKNHAASLSIIVFNSEVPWSDKISGEGASLSRWVCLAIRVSLWINYLLLMVCLIQILTTIALWREKSWYQLLLWWQEMMWLLNQCSWLKENRRLLMRHHSIVVIDKELILNKAWLMLEILFTLERILLFLKLLDWLPAWRSGMGRFRWKSSYWVRLRSILPLH